MSESNDDDDAEASDLCDREAVQIRLSVSKAWVDSELVPAYPHVTSVSQAARSALLEGVEAKRDDGSRGVEAAIGSEIVAAMERLGGSVENCQTVQINSPERVEIEDVSEE